MNLSKLNSKDLLYETAAGFIGLRLVDQDASEPHVVVGFNGL